MQITFPIWSDLGIDDSTSMAMRDTWEAELQHALRCYNYYSGAVFNEKVQDESIPEDLRPELFPIGVNLVKMMCLAQADATFGEYDELPVRFGTRRNLDITEDDKKAVDLANDILYYSDAQTMFWELDLHRNIFGGGAIRIKPVLKSKTSKAHIRWELISKDAFYPIWDPDDPNRILEAYVITPLTADQAKIMYGIEVPRGDTCNRIEHWTEDTITLKIDDVEHSTQPNVYRFVPFVYIPRLRSTHWWGDALTDDLTDVQDELNMRLADIGEAINYNSHPVRYGLNLPNSFNIRNYPLEPSALWDLGRAIGNSPPPEVGLLEAVNPVPESSFSYVKFLYDWSRTSVFAPPIAFGEDNGGGQRSGITLEIRLWPMLKAIRRSRAYLTIGLLDALKKSALILKQKGFSEIGSGEIEAILDRRIAVNYSPILPRDQQAAVDEVVKLLSTSPQAISIETAQDVLGRSIQEVTRIADMVDDDSLYREIETMVGNGDNSDNNKNNLPDG